MTGQAVKNKGKRRRGTSVMQKIVLLPVYFYKKCVSPFLPRSCIYYPSCSTYMVDAIKSFGVFKGIFLGIKRLLRCVPWKEGGSDPVPDNLKGDMKWLF